MLIHTVKEGETLAGIAKEYDTTKERIAENNYIYKDVCQGRELLILTPTRSYKVKAGDTPSELSRRFGVRMERLLMNNPSLQDGIYVGQELAIKYPVPQMGAVTLNGYCYGMGVEKLRRLLPFLTYVTVSAYRIEKRGLSRLWWDKEIVRLGKEHGKIMLLRARDNSDGKEYENANYRGELIKSLIATAKTGGYSGITLSCHGLKSNTELLLEFIKELKNAMTGSGLVLFTETDENVTSEAIEISDGGIFSYDKACFEKILPFSDAEAKIFKNLAKEATAAKIFIDLPSAVFGDFIKPKGIEEIFNLGKRCVIIPDEVALICECELGGGTGKFTSLKNIKARLDFASKLGFGGVSVDVDTAPREYFMLIYSLFAPVHLYTPFSLPI